MQFLRAELPGIMYYWRSVVVAVCVVTLVVAAGVAVYLLGKDSCPLGTLTCSAEPTTCIPQKYVCDERPDCPMGVDEDPVLCADLHGSDRLLNNLTVLTDSEYKRMLNICEIENFPPECVCKFSTRIYCDTKGLKVVPRNISGGVTHLVLAGNNINSLNKEDLEIYNLSLLHLQGNLLENLPEGLFDSQTILSKLFLMENNFTEIKCGTFTKLKSLRWLFLDQNNLQSICFEDFNLPQLEWLSLSNNKITLNGLKFPTAPKLLELFLHHNYITRVEKFTFSNLIKLELLSLRMNQINYIHPKAFRHLKELRELDLFGNKLTHLASETFGLLRQLSKLYLGQNPFHQLTSHLFENLTTLASLNLEDLEIINIDTKMFSYLTSLESIYFKKYKYCSYAPKVPRCRPLSDGISSTHQLLVKPILRQATWCISILTLIGNTFVLWGRFAFKDENKMLNFVIRNLAVSDLLMGIYLLIIGFQDLRYRDTYNTVANQWISSWSCTVAGILAMVSSEVSVLLMVFMSLDKFLLIVAPFGGFPSLRTRGTVTIVTCIWVTGIGVAVIPVINYLNSTRFYGINGLCFPLHIDDPFFIGWQYSSMIFLGVNSLSLILIVISYMGMFISIWTTRRATPLPINDLDFALRFLFIVLTDACCWIPIIALKILVLFGGDVSPDVYSWLVVFVLPINSAVNPFLYTFTTTKYRARVYKASLPICVQPKKGFSTFLKNRRQSPQIALETGSVSCKSLHRI